MHLRAGGARAVSNGDTSAELSLGRIFVIGLSVEAAASILAILKEPDAAMREAGDMAAWGAMIDAALRERWSLAQPPAAGEAPGGTDEEGDMRLTPDSVGHDRADWIHLHNKQEKPS